MIYRPKANKFVILIILIGCFFAFGANKSYAQGNPNLIQLSGLVVDGDSAYGVPGVHVFIKNANVGTASNGLGFFSLPTMVGDTVIFRAVGYKQQRMIIPNRREQGFSVLIDLKSDTTFLPVIEVFPYPTEEIFKEAFLALQLPTTFDEKMAKNLNPEMLTRMAMAMPMDGASNHRLYMMQGANQLSTQMMAPTFSILNPFAWAEFIRSVKNGDLKRKD